MFPSIPTVADGRILFAKQENTTSPRTFPNLSSLTKNAGDLLIAIIVQYQSSLTSAIWSSWGASFTELKDIGVASQHAIGVAYKWSTGSETGTFTVAQAGTITGYASMCLLSISGAHATTPPEITAALATGTTALADPAALAPSWGADDTLWISGVGCGETSGSGAWGGVGSAAPTNYSGWADANVTDTSTIGQCEVGVSFRQNNTSSENVGTASGVDLSNARNCAFVIAVKNAPLVAQKTGVAVCQ